MGVFYTPPAAPATVVVPSKARVRLRADALLQLTRAWAGRALYTADWQPLATSLHTLAWMGFFYALFFTAELLMSAVAFRFDRERMRLLWWLFWQRFVYRQLIYMALWKAVAGALRGVAHGWGKVERKATVDVTSPEVAWS